MIRWDRAINECVEARASTEEEDQTGTGPRKGHYEDEGQANRGKYLSPQIYKKKKKQTEEMRGKGRCRQETSGLANEDWGGGTLMRKKKSSEGHKKGVVLGGDTRKGGGGGGGRFFARGSLGRRPTDRGKPPR